MSQYFRYLCASNYLVSIYLLFVCDIVYFCSFTTTFSNYIFLTECARRICQNLSNKQKVLTSNLASSTNVCVNFMVGSDGQPLNFTGRQSLQS